MDAVFKVLFFARLREQLDCAEMSVPCTDSLATVDDLCRHLVKEGGQPWESTLGEANIICAVNQNVVTRDAPLEAGDEVAFFPPVTGG